ncbi:MAG: uroporphyrinogen decarboxylase [Firmicutes bacterium]|nr:uroporphyrinogen decarboxylase [Bacillota bacterium]
MKTIRLEKTPRLSAAVFSGGAWTFNQKGYTLESLLGKPELMAELIEDTNEKVQSDIVWAGSGFNNLPVLALGGRVKFRVKGTMDVIEPLLKEARDIERVDLDRLGDHPGVAGVWETASQLDRKLGDRILIGACGWGPFTLAGQFYGVERMMQSIYKDKASIHSVLEFAEEACFRYYQPFIKAGAQLLSVAEPTASGDLISRQHFEEFALPYLKRFMSRLKAAGGINLLHICGNITNRLDLIPDSGTDILSVDYKVDLARVKEVVGSRIAFAGNVNPAGVLLSGTPEEVAAASRECIEKAGPEGRLVLIPGCDLSPRVPIENVQAMIETGHNWQN